jgi:hypothetical protein
MSAHAIWKRASGVAPAGNLCDMESKHTHPLDIGDDLDGTDDRPQIPCRYCLSGQQKKAGPGSSRTRCSRGRR